MAIRVMVFFALLDKAVGPGHDLSVQGLGFSYENTPSCRVRASSAMPRTTAG